MRLISNVSLHKIKFIGQKIEIFKGMVNLNECAASYCCLCQLIVDFKSLRYKLQWKESA